MPDINNYAPQSRRVIGEDGKIHNLVDLLSGAGGGTPGEKGEKGDPGEKGATGATGKGVKAIALTTTDGAVTGGTVTFTDNSTAAITVTEA